MPPSGPNQQYTVTFTLEPTQAINGINAATSAFAKMHAFVQQTMSSTQRMFDTFGASVSSKMSSLGNKIKKEFGDLMSSLWKGMKNGFDSVIGGMYNKVKSLVGDLGSLLSTAVGFKAIVQAGVDMQKFESTLSMATGSIKTAKQEISWLLDLTKKLGISFAGSVMPFAKLFASSSGMLTHSQVRGIFESFGQAAAALRLDKQEIFGVFLALQQIASKGVVSMEELRLQLAERIPKAMVMAAESMDMSMSQFEKAVQLRLIPADLFLVRFSNRLSQEVGPAAKAAASTAQASIERFGTALFELKFKLSNSGLLTAFSKILDQISLWVSSNGPAIENFGKFLGDLGDDIANFIGKLKPSTIEDYVNGLTNFLQATRKFIVDELSKASKDYKSYFKEVGKAIGSSIVEGIKDAFVSGLEYVLAIRPFADDPFELSRQTGSSDRDYIDIPVPKQNGITVRGGNDSEVTTQSATDKMTEALWKSYSRAMDNLSNVFKAAKNTSLLDQLDEAKSNYSIVFRQALGLGVNTSLPIDEQLQLQRRAAEELPARLDIITKLNDEIQKISPDPLKWEEFASTVRTSKQMNVMEKRDLARSEFIATRNMAYGFTELPGGNRDDKLKARTKAVDDLANKYKEMASAELEATNFIDEQREEMYSKFKGYEDEFIAYKKSKILEQAKLIELAGFDSVKFVAAANKELKKSSDDAFRQAMEEAGNGVQGAKFALKDYAKTATNTFTAVGSIVTSVFGKVEDTLVTFLTKGKVSFKDFATSAIADLTRILIRMQVLGPIAQSMSTMSFAGVFGAAQGAVFSGGSVVPFNLGGALIHSPTRFPLNGNRTGLAGEAGEEGLFPLRRNRRGELAINAENSAPSVNMVINMVNQSGQNMSAEAEAPSFDGERYVCTVVLKSLTNNTGGFKNHVKQALSR